MEKNGFPPLKISGNKSKISNISLDSNVSSQFISALILIAPTLENGLKIKLEGKIVSKPYLNLTLKVLKKIGISYSFKKNIIEIKNVKKIRNNDYLIESDWTSLSYFYSIVAVNKKINIKLNNFFKDSFQGDSILNKIFIDLGVETKFLNASEILLSPIKKYKKPNNLSLNLIDSPDLAQTIAVTCMALKITVEITGLQTLKIKETDRILALNNELTKFGAKIKHDDSSIVINPPKEIKKNIIIDTYNDHRMALSVAPLGLIVPITINDPDVISKSFPEYWNNLSQLGFNLKNLN